MIKGLVGAQRPFVAIRDWLVIASGAVVGGLVVHRHVTVSWVVGLLLGASVIWVGWRLGAVRARDRGRA